MDLNQRKLSKEEWNGIEIPIVEREKAILNIIKNGFHDVNIKVNNTMTLINYLKISPNEAIDEFLYETYIAPKLSEVCRLNRIDLPRVNLSKSKLKKQDQIRLKNTDKIFETKKGELDVFEFKIIDELIKMLTHYKNRNDNWIVHYYTLVIFKNYTISNINTKLLDFTNNLLEIFGTRVTKLDLIKKGYDMIERNENLLKYADMELYEHQKELFTVCKHQQPKLILYIAPTGTGKTLSPLGLSEHYKVLFVCAARHIGLALAKNAISINKKIGFAFGCGSSEDVRLHYYAAKEYSINKRSGNIGKVDNTVGDKVEILISDVKSFIPAMLYLLAFNPAENIIVYWDEPTITMDYENHDLHALIQKNWKENLIPNFVLSSATLPTEEEIGLTINDFRNKFSHLGQVEVHTIVSHDCKKTIPLINKEGYVEMPHYIYGEDYSEVKKSATHCEKFKTILRYLDLSEAIKFIVYLNERGLVSESDGVEHERNFPTVESVNMKNIKSYYLKLLKKINKSKWKEIYEYFKTTRQRKHTSNIYVTTNDAYTLTDGPTIFLADDTTKIGSFCIQTAEIPSQVLTRLAESISHNNEITEQINDMEKELEDLKASDVDKDKKNSKDTDGRDSEKKSGKSNTKSIKEDVAKRLNDKIDLLRTNIQPVVLNESFVPNTVEHLARFNKTNLKDKPFTCDISSDVIEKIMQIYGIEDSWKLLLMMGIGVFANQDNPAYMEILKKLAQEQKLYMIIASSDYIYGTNYQFCHGYISKDLGTMSQEKCIQAMGRVGRNSLQYTYSIRFRENDLIHKLFQPATDKPEVENMNRLFNSD